MKAWDGVIDSIHLVSEGINLVYRFERQGLGYYLRMTHAKLRGEVELLAAIAYQRHLFEHAVPVCEPITSRNSLWVEHIQQGSELFLAHVCREVPGEPICFDSLDLVPYQNWGRALGQLHHAAMSYDPGAHAYTSWDQSLEELHEYAQHESTALQRCLAEVDQFLKDRNQSSLTYGLTHGDHREGNVLRHGREIHIIDFDLPSMNWFTEDVARPFFHSIVLDEKNWQDKIGPYLEGYFSVMPKESIDLSALPKQIQMKCLEIYLWTKNNWSGGEAPGGGDTATWLQRIHQKITDPTWAKQFLSFS
ncbi:MAG: phosphotransferase [Gammaproteobacteria bacterium]|nr:phosphotransferase [Gammaproteobacteria bacterium]